MEALPDHGGRAGRAGARNPNVRARARRHSATLPEAERAQDAGNWCSGVIDRHELDWTHENEGARQELRAALEGSATCSLLGQGAARRLRAQPLTRGGRASRCSPPTTSMTTCRSTAATPRIREGAGHGRVALVVGSLLEVVLRAGSKLFRYRSRIRTTTRPHGIGRRLPHRRERPGARSSPTWHGGPAALALALVLVGAGS